MHNIRLTKKLINGMNFFYFTNFISNGHWLINKRLVGDQKNIQQLYDNYGEKKEDDWLNSLMKRHPVPFNTKMKLFCGTQNDYGFPVSIFASEDGLKIAVFQECYIEQFNITELYMNACNGLGCTMQNPMKRHKLLNEPFMFLMPVLKSDSALATYKVLSGKGKAEWLLTQTLPR